MHFSIRTVPVLLWIGLSLGVMMLAGCHNNDCKDVICAPCPSSRLVIYYQDSATGSCVPGFHSSAMIYGFDKENPGDTIRKYNLSDSCLARIIVQENMVYHLVAMGVRDTIVVDSFAYQEPVEVVTCCLCYPVEHADIRINGVHQHVEWEVGKYDNTPIKRNL